ncbi:MAG: hypothetical protein ACR2P4_07390 [Gammaproteobacteria bacterium]
MRARLDSRFRGNDERGGNDERCGNDGMGGNDDIKALKGRPVHSTGQRPVSRHHNNH